MELREYQKSLIKDTFKALEDGYNAPCIVLPCGGGKSVILAEIAKIYTHSDRRILFLVHRKELVAQIFSTFVRYGVKMESCDVEMVQTVCRRLHSRSKPDLIITDENHHSLAKTYKRIYEYYRDIPRIGVTATPERIDGSGLADVNDKLIIGVSTKWLIDHNYLAPYDYYAPVIDMPKFHIQNGDFARHEVADFFSKNRSKVYGDVIRHYRTIAENKQAIAYLPTIESSKETAQMFRNSGISAAHIDGDTPKAERDRIISEFRCGELKILCNVDIVSEGFDVPDCECVILLRPTKSLILYTQQSMRCMRYKPGKRAIIIDHVNNIKEFGFPDREREWLLEGHPHAKGSGETLLKICDYCFAAVPLSVRVCPICGGVFKCEKHEKEYVDTKLIKLENAHERVKFYISPNECESVQELVEYAKYHGYKRGWVYYQQRARGWLNGKPRNENSKRYPCRAVKGWDSQEK